MQFSFGIALLICPGSNGLSVQSQIPVFSSCSLMNSIVEATAVISSFIFEKSFLLLLIFPVSKYHLASILAMYFPFA